MAVILMYHRVTDLERDPYNLAVLPKHFRHHIEYIREKAQPMSLNDLVNSLKQGHVPERGVVITMDDGYADNLYCALPILHETKTPVTIFVSCKYINGEQEFWWDELERVFSIPFKFPLTIHFRLFDEYKEWMLKNDKDCWNTHKEIHTLLLPLRDDERIPILDELYAQFKIGRNIRPNYRPISSKELIQLAKDELVEIGAHTITHQMLSALKPKEQRQEIQKGREQIECIIGQPVVNFAYPFGMRESFTQKTVKIVKQLGFRSASTSISGRITSNHDHFFHLPRCGIENWDIDIFIRHLESLIRDSCD